MVPGNIGGLMGLLNFLQSIKEGKATKEKQRLYADLLQMASADGNYSDEEISLMQALTDTVGDVNLKDEKFSLADSLALVSDGLTLPKKMMEEKMREWDNLPYPKSEKKKLRYLLLVVSLMIADGECTTEEIQLCYQIAAKMGLNEKHVYSCIVYLSQRNDTDMKRMSGLLSYFENGGYNPQ